MKTTNNAKLTNLVELTKVLFVKNEIRNTFSSWRISNKKIESVMRPG